MAAAKWSVSRKEERGGADASARKQPSIVIHSRKDWRSLHPNRTPRGARGR